MARLNGSLESLVNIQNVNWPCTLFSCQLICGVRIYPWFTYILYIPNDAYKHIICMIYDIRYAHVFVVFYFSVFISLVSHLMELFIFCVPSINLSNIFLHGSRNLLPAQGHWGQIVWILLSCAWQGTFANYRVSKMTFYGNFTLPQKGNIGHNTHQDKNTHHIFLEYGKQTYFFITLDILVTSESATRNKQRILMNDWI